MGEYLYGSRQFVEKVFVPMFDTLHITEETFAGAIILDTMMNWDNTDNSQQLPPEFDMVGLYYLCVW